MRSPVHPSADWRSRLAAAVGSPWGVVAILSVVTFLVYCRTLSFGFVWDDHSQIVSNPLLRSWKMIPYAFLRDAGYGLNVPVRYYRPLYVVWSFLGFALFHFHPWGWHLASVLLHITVTGCVYWFARVLKQSHWVAALSALLFAIHPVHVEVVSWLSAVEDALATLFALLAFFSFVKATACPDAQAIRWKVLSCAFLLAALWSKEIALAFAATVFTYSWLTGQGHSREGAKHAAYQALPYIGVTVFYLILRQAVLQHIAQPPADYSPFQVLLTLPKVLLGYLRLLFWPVGLSPLHEIPYVSRPGLSSVFLPLAVLIILLLALRLWWKRSRDPIVAFLAWWMLFSLLPVLYLPVFNAGEFVRDRYVYLSSVAFVVLVAKAICSLTERLRSPLIWTPVLVLLAGALISATVVQQAQWANDLALFERAHRLNPQNDHAALDLALVLMNHGDYARARPLLEDILTRHSSAPILHINLAIVYGNQGDPSRAAAALRETFWIEPDYANNAIKKLELARADEALGNYPQALVLLNDIWRDNPDYYRVAVEMARTYNQMGKPVEAELWLRHDLTIDPQDSEAHCQLALALRQQNRNAEADQQAHASEALYPALPCNPADPK